MAMNRKVSSQQSSFGLTNGEVTKKPYMKPVVKQVQLEAEHVMCHQYPNAPWCHRFDYHHHHHH